MNGANTELQVLNKIKDLLANNNVCIGTQELTIDGTVKQLTVPIHANYVLIQTESDVIGKAIRYWSDGITIPTTVSGVYRGDNEAFDIMSAQTAKQIKFTQAQNGIHKINVEYYK